MKKKTSKARIRANSKYEADLKAMGYKRLAFWIKPEWKEAINQLIDQLTNYKG
jgi:hypothetical protein